MKQSHLTEHAWHTQHGKVDHSRRTNTYYFQLNKQLVDICHVSQNQQAGDGREEGARRPDHVPAFDRGAGVISKLPRSALHQVTCARGGEGLTSETVCDVKGAVRIPGQAFQVLKQKAVA